MWYDHVAMVALLREWALAQVASKEHRMATAGTWLLRRRAREDLGILMVLGMARKMAF
jgi:hypothetical protein